MRIGDLAKRGGVDAKTARLPSIARLLVRISCLLGEHRRAAEVHQTRSGGLMHRIAGFKWLPVHVILLCSTLVFASVHCPGSCASDPPITPAQSNKTDAPPCHQRPQPSSKHQG